MTPDASLRGLSDEELGVRLLDPRAERELFTEAYRRFYPLMLREAAIRLGGDMALAEDVVQECFAQVFLRGKIGYLRNPAHLRSYLLTSVRFRVVDAIRRQRHHEALTSAIEDTIGEAPPDLWEVHPSLEEVLAGLDEDERQILSLRYLQKLTIGEIAKRLNTGYSAAAQRLSRALQAARARVPTL